ncbi:NAD-dependent epimerase/dehydratase family protein [Puteibacter caeruleilacunae]|nr:NAD-dependent epimerase/dehydratase family protein [Puteibacter caeruleilacunae]
MVLVTGGTGMLGAHLILHLLKKGEQVRALRRSTSDLNKTIQIFSFYEKDPMELFNKIEWVEGDILERHSLDLILDDITTIYHTAAVVSFQKKDKWTMLENNVDGTANLINAALDAGIKKFCHVSSIAALGKTENGDPADETTIWSSEKKVSAYSESKFFSEMEAWRGVNEGMDVVIVNPSIILGPGDWHTGSPKYFSTIDKGLKFFTKGASGYVDVNDVCRSMLMLINSSEWEHVKNKRYILNADNLAHRDVFNNIADELGKKRPSIQASKCMLIIGWLLSSIKAALTGKESTLTRSTLRSANNVSRYNGQLITTVIPFNYTPISDSIKEIAKIYKQAISSL